LCLLDLKIHPVVAQVPAANLMVQTPPEFQQEQQGRKHYEAGQFSQAATIWQQVEQAYQVQGDSLNQARLLSNLSLTYQQLGLWPQAKQAIAESLQLLQKQTGDNPNRRKILAQALNTQGKLQLALGKSEQALTIWQQAAAIYRQADDNAGVTSSLINQAQALKALGFYRRALATLTEANQILQKQPDSLIKAAGLRSLGSTLSLTGDLDQSRQVLQQSLAMAQRLKSSQDVGETLFSLGNTARAQQDSKAALEFYRQTAAVASSPSTQVQAQLNQLSLLLEIQEWSAAQALWPQIRLQIANLPPSRTGIYARINFAQSLTRLKQTTSTATPPWPVIAQLLATAVQQAKSLEDQRATSYALGSLGGLYEQTQQWSYAQNLTQQALLLAQTSNAPDITYRWQWQLGRLLKVQGDTPGAIAAYTEAVNTLQTLRQDLAAINADVQFSFRDSVEPVYRQLVGLLLQPKGSVKPSQQNLAQARSVIEALQVAELDNFFRQACLDTQPVQIDQVDPQAAVIYPIILSDRLEVILSLPRQPLRHYTTHLPQDQIESSSEQLRQTLVTRTSRRFLPLSQQVYRWLIQPAEADLVNSRVKTLVFVLDGPLRNIPMAALHDGKQYLIEKYGIALTPSLRLLDPQPLKQRQLRALAAGLTEARQGFAPLENVALELAEVKSEVPSEILLNQEFTRTTFQNELKSSHFPVVHIATHGQFSSKPEETFILTWDDRINVNQLDNLLQAQDQSRSSAIELLVLSACETAAGDRRAALGLAGIAVQAGARSTLSTLWSIDDAATAELMNQFYSELAKAEVTKAEALRRAQRAILKVRRYNHPIYWAPYVLVGNWL